MRFYKIGLASLGILSLAACDLSGDFLFPGAIEGVPGVLHITAEDGGPLVPFDFNEGCDGLEDEALSECQVQNTQENTIYVEIGPTGDANPSGATLNFEGTGGSVCILVDPELVYWNQSVSLQGAVGRWRFPDNPYDDGDVDISTGLSVYYTGTEGEEMGNFAVQYDDSLENTVPVNLVACTITSTVLNQLNPTATSGRGAPEYCTISNTQPGVNYTVAMEVFSLPPDDNRLMMGLVLSEGGCNPLIDAAAPDESGQVGPVHQECVIRGEAIPGEGDGQIYYGYEEGRSWPGSEEFENHFCTGEPMRAFCNDEFNTKEEAGIQCNYTEPASIDEKCYCGDQRDTPDGGF